MTWFSINKTFSYFIFTLLLRLLRWGGDGGEGVISALILYILLTYCTIFTINDYIFLLFTWWRSQQGRLGPREQHLPCAWDERFSTSSRLQRWGWVPKGPRGCRRLHRRWCGTHGCLGSWVQRSCHCIGRSCSGWAWLRWQSSLQLKQSMHREEPRRTDGILVYVWEWWGKRERW